MDLIKKRLKSVSGDPDNIDTDVELRLHLSDIFFLDRALKRLQITRFLNRLIQQAGLRWTVGRIVLLVLFLTSMGYHVANMIGLPSIVSVAIGIGIGIIPFAYVLKKRQTRIRKIEEQLPDCISLFANVLRAGLGLTVGMELVGEEMPEPSSGEFRKTVAEMSFGLDLEHAMEHLTQRVPTPELSLFVTSVLLQREVGGNLAEFLDKLELTIRERFKLRRELKTGTAQVRFSGWIVALIPIIVGGMLFVINPDYMKVLFHNPLGQLMLVIAFILEVFGFLLMKKLTMVKI